MSTERDDIETLVRKARALVNMVMENLGTGHEATDDTEYALWVVSDLLSQVEQHLEESSEWSDLGEDELAVQNEGGIMRFDQVFPTDRVDVKVTPEGVTLTTMHGEDK